MLRITCPWCGPREESEFSYGGEAQISRPADPYALADDQWAEYLFIRKNIRGQNLEQWCHSAGCRRWFTVTRDTVTYKISAVYKDEQLRPQGGEGA